MNERIRQLRARFSELISHDTQHPEMRVEKVEVYSHATNSAIIRMPERKFPGVLIQGDSLSILFAETMELVEALATSKDEEAFFTALFMAERLESHLLGYEETLVRNGIKLPYHRDPAVTTKKFAQRWPKDDFQDSNDGGV